MSIEVEWTWFWGLFKHVMESVHGAATVLGIVVGVFLTEFFAHILPPDMNAYSADRLTRLVCLGVSMTTTFALDATLVGFFLALLAGLAGPTVHGFVLRYIASRWPNLVPKALIESPTDKPSAAEIRPLLPRNEGEK